MRTVQRIAVLGAGTMGHGIAQVAALHGLAVRLRDVEPSFLERGLGLIRQSLGRMVKAGRIAADEPERVLERVAPTTDLATAVADADLVVEAVPEVLSLKQEVFAALDRLTAPDVVLATNTSQFSITSIAAATRRPALVVGMHWFNPPQVMRLIEVVRSVDTSDETLALIRALAERLGKETVTCADSQGFIASRLVAILMVEAARLLDEGVATREDIDKAVRLGLNHPMGPLELADFTGLDTAVHVAENLAEALGDRFKPSRSLRNLVRAGYLGRKAGRGFYHYGGPSD